MDIPQNDELFRNVIDANNEALGESGSLKPSKKVLSADQEIEEEIRRIREKLRGTI